MNEASKFRKRHEREGTLMRYLSGLVLDVGCGNNIILPDAKGWDLQEGDATFLAGIPDCTFDALFSSHCLEHLSDPPEAIRNWWRVLKPEGYLVVVVPDEDLYEQGRFPSQFNGDHKFSYTISKDKSWSTHSVNLCDLILELPNHKVWSIRVVDEGYDYSKICQGIDQSLGEAEVGIEMIVQKGIPK
jgi:SAM-dependent methyltransferase